MHEPFEHWTEASQAILRDSVYGVAADGCIPPREAAGLAAAEGLGRDALLLGLLGLASQFSRAPVSGFPVGAVALGASGAVYLGANLEFAGAALNNSVHAEQAAIANAHAHGEHGIEALAVTATPCGHCRQFLNEITAAAGLRVLVEHEPPRTLADLLPAAFGPTRLGVTTGLLDTPAVALRLVSGADDQVAGAALHAASRAYAPYSRSPSGCAVLTASGRIASGACLENAAYNPSLSPLQSALVHVILGNEDVTHIRRVVLVELQGATISQRAATEAVIALLAPGVRLGVVEIERR